ncbi:hypothetical protein YC2023_035787 [Brassica napus]
MMPEKLTDLVQLSNNLFFCSTNGSDQLTKEKLIASAYPEPLPSSNSQVSGDI